MIKKGLIAGIINLIIGLGINFLIQVLFPTLQAEYQNESMFRPWTDPLMMVYFAYPFITGIALAFLWTKLNRPKPFEFAKIYFLVGTIPGMFITYTSFKISLLMVLVWTLTGFVESYVAGFVFTKTKK